MDASLELSPGYNLSLQKARRNRQRSEEWSTLLRSVPTSSSMSDLGKLVFFQAGDYVNVIDVIDEGKESGSMRAYNVYFVGVHRGTYYGYTQAESGKKRFVHFHVNCIYGYVRASSPLM
tara:strand:+ start:159 stop:515 length:357 start_codon:yes stop_codon:yes gene_type:complete